MRDGQASTGDSNRRFAMVHTSAKGAALFAFAAMMAMTGCHKHHPLPPPNAMAPSTEGPAPTAEITATPTAIDLGQSVVLNWRTTNATSASIDGIGQVPTNGTQTVSPANSTDFHLTARGDGGTAEADVRVTVNVPETPNAETNSNSSTVTNAELHAAVPDIFFGYDSYDIAPDQQAAITDASRYLTAHPDVRIVISGYCDDRGSAEYNITLGENRANAVKQALVSQGISADRMRVISYGKERQFCTEETPACWQQNRRAQFTVDQ